VKTLSFSQTVLALACGAALAILPGSARAQIYVYSQDTHNGGNAIVGAYNYNGSAINASLVTGLTFNPYIFNNLAVSDTALYVYNPGAGGYYSEYSLSGATIKANLTGAFGWSGGATVAGGDLYVANYIGNTIGTYNATSGAVINASLISSGLNVPYSPVIAGGHIFVANAANNVAGNGTVGEFNLDGSAVNTALISGLTQPFSISLANGYLYITSLGAGNNGKVGVYDATTGAAVNANLVTGLGGGTQQIAVTGNSLYVAKGGTVAEYNATSGALVNSSLITGLGTTAAIVTGVTPTPEPGTCALIGVGLAGLFAARRRK